MASNKTKKFIFGIKIKGSKYEATREAVRHMITMLGVEYGLERTEAYILCSVAGDLRMHEVVRTFVPSGSTCMLTLMRLAG